MYRGAIWSKKCNPKPVPFWSTLLIIFDPFSAFVRSAFRVCSIVFSIRVLLDPRRGSRITHCADENPGVPPVPTEIQEYPLCLPGSRVTPPGIQSS